MNGLPTFVQMESLSVTIMLMNKMMSITDGTTGVNALSYICKIVTFAFVPFNAITQASAPVIGYNHGTNNSNRVKEALRFSLIISVFYSVAALVSTPLISKYLIMIFTDSADLIVVGANGLNILSAALPFAAIQLIAGSYYQAIGKKNSSLLVNIMPVIFLIPGVFVLPKLLSVNGIWWSFVTTYFLSAVFIAILPLSNAKKNRV